MITTTQMLTGNENYHYKCIRPFEDTEREGKLHAYQENVRICTCDKITNCTTSRKSDWARTNKIDVPTSCSVRQVRVVPYYNSLSKMTPSSVSTACRRNKRMHCEAWPRAQISSAQFMSSLATSLHHYVQGRYTGRFLALTSQRLDSCLLYALQKQNLQRAQSTFYLTRQKLS